MCFPYFTRFFIFILMQHWMGLLPGVGTMGMGHDVNGEFHLTTPLIRPVMADFNATIAYALGLPHDLVLMSPTKRPFKIADKGTPVTSIFG